MPLAILLGSARSFASFALVITTIPQQSSAQQPVADATLKPTQPVYRAVRASSAIQVDGRLDDAAWAGAATIERLTQIEPNNGTPSQFRTTFRILFDKKFLYLGKRARRLGHASLRRIWS